MDLSKIKAIYTEANKLKELINYLLDRINRTVFIKDKKEEMSING